MKMMRMMKKIIQESNGINLKFLPGNCKGGDDFISDLNGLHGRASFHNCTGELVAHNEARISLFKTTEYMELTASNIVRKSSKPTRDNRIAYEPQRAVAETLTMISRSS